MNKKDEIKMMIEHPEYIIHAEKLSIEARIKQKKLDTEAVKDAVVDTAKSQGKGIALDILNGKWGDLIFDIADTGDHLKNKLDDMKKAILLAEYLQKVDDQEQGLLKLSDLITDPYGLSIYSKIVTMLSDSPADDDLLAIMSDYLKKLTEADDLSQIFSQAKSILNLIDKSSPQALILLQNKDVWPLIPTPKAAITVGGRVQGDNTKLVASAFATVPQFRTLSVTSLQMAIVDLEMNGLAEFVSGTLPRDDQKTVYTERLTDTGNMLRDAIQNDNN
jgi:hypothetical protein|nr:MAG TPA: hypothetical protein [Caudoviricetes sp.]